MSGSIGPGASTDAGSKSFFEQQREALLADIGVVSLAELYVNGFQVLEWLIMGTEL